MRAFLIHGSFGSPDENWFPWLKRELENRGVSVVVPTFPTPENQSLTTWLDVWQRYSPMVDEESIFVGHSLGSAFILSVLENVDCKVGGCFLVSGFLGPLGMEEFDSVNRTFTTKEFDWQMIRRNCERFVIFQGDNDPYVPLVKGQELSNILHGKLHVVQQGKHLNSAAGFTKFPELLTEILS